MMAKSLYIKRMSLLAAMILFLELRPYFAWSFIENSFVKTGLLVLLSLLFFSNRKRTVTKKEVPYLSLFILAAFCYSFFAVIRGRVNFNGFINSLTCILLISIPLCQQSFGESVFNSFATLFSVLVGLSLLSWIISIIFGLPQLGTLEIVSQNRQYLHYPFYVVEVTNYSALDLLRFSGPFDEPGVVGTYGALILTVTKYNFKDWRTIVIFTAGVLSFSLFFYIISVAFLLFYFLVVRRQVLVSLLLVASFFLLYLGTRNNPIFYEYIWKRAEWNVNTKTIEGDNRSSESVDAYLNNIRGTDDYYFGTSDSNWAINVANSSTSTYKSIICIHGVIFFVLYLSFFLTLGLKNINKKTELLLYCIVVLANFYQRPGVFVPVPVFLYCSFAFGYLDDKRSQLYRGRMMQQIEDHS